MIILVTCFIVLLMGNPMQQKRASISTLSGLWSCATGLVFLRRIFLGIFKCKMYHFGGPIFLARCAVAPQHPYPQYSWYKYDHYVTFYTLSKNLCRFYSKILMSFWNPYVHVGQNGAPRAWNPCKMVPTCGGIIGMGLIRAFK